MRIEEHTCFPRACINQQLAGPMEDRQKDRGKEREAVLAGRWRMPNRKEPSLATAVLSLSIKHYRRDNRIETKKETLHTLKTGKIHSHSCASLHSQGHSMPLICPCHTYKELVQEVHELPLTSSLRRLPPGPGQLSLH